jgi:crossover junction endodeoxyribonuclease RusA
VTVVTSTRSLAIEITVYGSPAPQGSKSFKGFTRAGRAILAESSKHVRPWRDAVRADALLVRNTLSVAYGSWKPLDEPLAVEMVFTVPKPSAAPKRRRTWPMRMPDLSKLCRATEDALTDAGIWRDDARVVGYDKLWKVYPGEDVDALEAPGAVIRIYRIAETA